MSDCRSCKHNTYQNIAGCDFVSCGHPVTMAKTPKPEPGDPAWVDAMTADMRISQMESYSMLDCAAWEARS
ncbi:hypothetical protein EOS93_25280 [Rhizobium sp. RMa-01]|uniref:hypothetical protein n=1 Tax=unclassified Rhizobium TaxID=2613769 RepID=UPI0008DA965F|nr:MULTISPECIES: hypothetical protein [unclassified Rhizobium]OHV24928.1 hypothetical protein BBJ66_22555 [Rhizobium sp. RSm-3]RVU08364.1 hypothetical protein EOS93_25280 [Rhizobium sp. RMa-01]